MKRCVYKLGFLALVAVLALFSVSIVLAQNETVSGFDEEKSYSWLSTTTSNWANLDVFSQSLAILALINHGDDVSAGVSNLKGKEDNDGCWPSGGCKVTESALATLALNQAGQDVAKEKAWLEDKNGALNPALTTGSWLIQIEAQGNGTCTLTFGANNQTKTFTVNGNKITPTSKTYWIDVEQDLQAGLVSNKISEKVDVNCGNLQTGAIVSLLYKTGNNFYILEEYRQSGTLTINNGCYASTKSGSVCDKLSTMYASWALKEMNEEIATRAYLESQITVNDILENAIVGRITGKPLYLDSLKAVQETTGGWSGGNVYATSFSIFALYLGPYQDQSKQGIDYLQRVATADGHWGNNVKDTSMALIALHGKDLEKMFVSGIVTPEVNVTETIEICDNNIDDDDDSLIDCGDSDCTGDINCPGAEHCNNGELDADEEDVDCGGVDCSSCITAECTIDDDCNVDNGETCVDGSCVAGEQPACTEDTDCDADAGETCDNGECVAATKGAFPTGLVISIIIILLILGGGAFFYLKYIKTGKFSFKDLFKKKPKGPIKPTFSYPAQRPLPTMERPMQKQAPMKKMHEEDELEKSLKEAEKLLYGK